jgi:hypothetical protein
VTDPGAPPQVPYDQLTLVQQTRAAQVFTGVDAAGECATIIALTPAGQADPVVRGTFEQAIGAGLFGRTGPVEVHAGDLTAARPWAATSSAHTGPTGRPGVAALLSTLPEPGPAGAQHPFAAAAGVGVGVRGSAGPSAAWNPAAWNPATPYAPGPPYQAATPPRPWQRPPTQVPTTPSQPLDRFLLAISAAVIVVVVLGGVAITVIMNAARSGPNRRPAAAAASTAPGAGWTLPSPSPSPSATPPTTWAPSPPLGATGPGPRLRQVPARRVVGVTFGPADRTFTMAFDGWPLAFRVPQTWGCIGGSAPTLPDAKAWVCVDEQNPGSRQRVSVMLRPCPASCTLVQRQTMDNAWFDEPANARRRADERTSFVETRRDAAGFYTVALSRFTPAADQPLKWQVGVFVKSPPQTAGAVQKILNDIYSQTP